MKFYQTKTFIVVGLLVVVALGIIAAMLNFKPKLVAMIFIGGCALVFTPRLNALQRQKETTDIDANGQTMLFNAYLYEDAQRYLDQGADVSATDIKGQTALHVQVEMDHVDIAELLMAHGASPNVPDYKGRTPLFYAKSAKTAEALVKNNADINAKDQDGNSVLTYIMQEREKLNGQTSANSLNKIAKYDELLAFLQTNGAD